MAMVSSAYITNIISSFEHLINNKITKDLGITNEAKKLVNRLEKVLDVLEDAERKKIGDEDVMQWLVELRDAGFELEKVIDYCRIEAHKTRRKEKQPQKQATARPRLFASCFSKSGLLGEISKSLRTLNLKMKAILKEKTRLNLKHVVMNNTCTAAATIQDSPRSLYSDTYIGANIEADSRYLVNILTKEETNEEVHRLMAIVGVGGIGKTTLARKIFNDERVRGSFNTRIWISLSSSLKDTSLLSTIIDAAGGNPGKSTTRARLERKLATIIARKRFLLVLNDVSDGRIWENLLRAPLQAGAGGSRILVTTRDENVAVQMGVFHVHDVKRLSLEEGWQLLHEIASLQEVDDSDILMEIGLNISERCEGLPLAIKIIGGVLKRKEPTINEWMAVCDSQTWSMEGLPDGILHALYLGYEDLHLNLKQCFRYCSLFPRNFCIGRNDLIRQWVSEGFVTERDGSTLEEIGEEYYIELVERYLIYPEPECDDTERCKMHDCLVDMARLLCLEEISVDDLEKLGDSEFKPCHVSLAGKGIEIIPEEIKTKETLRTLILSKNPIKDDGLRDVFTKLRQLRVLDISEIPIEVIPDTLRNLLHLRFLNLSRTKIKELPESIGYLHFLQTLVLQECRRLHSLPKGIEHLKNLRNLDLTGTMIYQFLFRIGKLMNLNSLDFFIVNTKLEGEADKKGWPLGELKNLNKLRSLHILQLDKTEELDEAKEALLGSKPCLKELELRCSDEATPLENPITQNIEGIIEELCPPSCLETLKIVNYYGPKYPSWLSIDSLSNLQRLELISCQYCRTLAPLGQLPQLQFLYMANYSHLRDIGPEIMGTSKEFAFPKLEKLHIQSLQNLESWTGLERPGSMPCLKVFQLESCPKIRFLPTCIKHSNFLKELRIIDCQSLEFIKNLTRIKELSVWNTPNLRRISNLTSLEDLSISHCPNLKIVKNVNSLKSVQIFDYDLEAIPRWLHAHAFRIESLDLACKVEMLQSCLINGPDWDIIQEITHVYGHSNNCTYFSYNKSPFSFETNLSVLVPSVEENSITETILIETIVEETQETFSKEDSWTIDEIVTVTVDTRSKEPSVSRSPNHDHPTILINPISPSPTTTITDNVLPNVSENTFGVSNTDTDNIGTSTGGLVRRRSRRNNITEVASIDAETNVHAGGSTPSDLVLKFSFGMPNDASTTGEALTSKNVSSHKISEKIASQNASNFLSLDSSSLDNADILISRTKTLSHQNSKNNAIEKPKGSFSSNLISNSFYSDPNAFTNEKLVESTFTLNSRIETLSDQNSGKEAKENTNPSLNFSSSLENEPIQIQTPDNFNSTMEPISHESMVEEANHFFATVEEITNVVIDPVEGIHRAGKVEEDDLINQPIENASSGTLSIHKFEVNDKLRIKERLKDYLIVILLAVSVMQLFFIFWLILWFLNEVNADRS